MKIPNTDAVKPIESYIQTVPEREPTVFKLPQHTINDPGFPETPKHITAFNIQGHAYKNNDLLALFSKLLPHSYEALLLNGNQMGPTAMNTLSQYLQTNPGVKHLIMSQTGLTQFAIAGLADMLKVNREIGWLVLNNNEIENRAAIQLAAGLKNNDSVKHLVLSDNHIEDPGIEAIALAIQSHPRIQTLFIQNNPISAQGIMALLNACKNHPSLQKIDCRGIDIYPKSLWQDFRQIAAESQIKLRFS